MRNTGLEEAQAGIKIAGRNINNLRYADDTTLMAESKELKSLLMKVKEESEEVGLKPNIQNTKMIPVTAGVRHITPSCSRPSKIQGRAQTLYRVGNSTDKEPSQKPSIQKLHKTGW